MTDHLTDTNVGNIEYIRKQDALDALGVTKNATKYGGDHSGYDTRMLYEIHDALTGIPAADVAPVGHGYGSLQNNIAHLIVGIHLYVMKKHGMRRMVLG